MAFESARSSTYHLPEESRLVRYVVITPARNEGREVEQTIQSILRQTVLPLKWVIVDDGSSDGSSSILDAYAERFSWIEVVRRQDRGFRSPGGGVVQAFQDGYAAITSIPWDFIVKLDADLSLEPDYFECCFNRFLNNPRLGIGGGTVYTLSREGREVESNPKFHVRGATKIYRRACWEAIGGLVVSPGWDTVDEVKATMLGWKTESFDEIMVLQRRLTGSKDGVWRDYVKNGRANYICGYHPLFMLLKCVKRMCQKPYLVASLALAYGYIASSLDGTPRVRDAEVIRYLRRQQIRRLLLINSIWR